MYYNIMNLNRNNYEEFFLLYVDNELPDAERRAVEAFVRQNPDLEAELILLQGTKMKPDSEVLFGNKEVLLKHEETDYQELFLLYVDRELDAEKMKAVEELASRDPYFQKELLAFQMTRIEADENLVFEGKEILLREERSVRLFPRISAAVAALLIIFAGYYFFRNPNPIRPVNKNKASSVVAVAAKKLSPAEIVTPHTARTLYSSDQSNHRLQAENKTQMKRIHPKRMTPTELIIPETLNRSMEIAKINDPTTETVHFPGINIIPLPGPAYAHDITADTEDGIYLANVSESKNKMRGLFRRVSRVFEKTTSAGEDKGRRSILIGGFQIALK
jgi:hypothetical protein